MDFTPLVNEVMKAGPWALIVLLMIWASGRVFAGGFVLLQSAATWAKPMVGDVVQAHLEYLKNMADGQRQTHECLLNQTEALNQNNKLLASIDQNMRSQNEYQTRCLDNQTKLIAELHGKMNHRTGA